MTDASTQQSSHSVPAVPSVYCVIVNWNGIEDTLACLDSVSRQDYPSLHTIVVDNGSTDGSVTRIRAAFPQVTLIETHKNLGFSSGCNAGIRHAIAQGADFVWLLNNDTVAPPDTCSKLVAKAFAEPNAGLIGSVLYFMHDPSQVQAWGGGNHSALLGRTTHFYSPHPFSTNSYVTFASALIPRNVILQVGVLYEGFFMYWDDTDYALRVTRHGYSFAIAEDTAILHKEGGSSAPRSPLVDRFSAASGLHFLRRHSPAPMLSMVIFLFNKLLIRLIRLQPKNFRAVLAAVSDYRNQRRRTYSESL